MSNINGWQLSGDGPSTYEKYVVPAYTGTWAKEIVNRSCIQKSEKILDVACGTGLVARTVSELFNNDSFIYGIDVNEAMLKKAFEMNKDINWHHGDVAEMPFSENSFDVVICQQGLQYFSDRSHAINEMRRVLVNRGRILLSVWRPIQFSPFFATLCKALEQYVNTNAAATLSSAFAVGNREELRILFNKAGFKKVHISLVIKQMSYSPFEEFLVGGISATPFFKDILGMEESLREEMLLSIYNSSHDYIDDGGLVAPMECYIVEAQK
jgi:ubiquinone/menaquinone biosynthesis C-methylase UbiE